MTDRCPGSDELIAMFDGEVTNNRALEIEAHAATCSTCRAKLEELGELARDLATPIAGADDAVDRVMASLDRAPPRRAAPAAGRWPIAVAFGGVAAAAAIIIFVAVGASSSSKPSEFQSRGGASEGAKLRRFVALTITGDGQLLAEGSRVRSGTRYHASYHNLLRDDPVYLLLFAVDSRATVHWLYPGFTDPDTDPPAIQLAATEKERGFPEEVVLDQPATGELRILALITPFPLQVSAIESLAPAQRTSASLLAKWPAAEVRDLAVTVSP